MPRRFWTYLEQEAGQPHPVSWELLGAAQRLAAEANLVAGTDAERVAVEAVLLGHNVHALAEEAIRYGAQTVYLLDSPALHEFLNKPYTDGVVSLAQTYQPEIFLIGATTLGRDLAGSVATSLETGLTADCTHLQIGEVKGGSRPLLLATRPAFGGNVIATIVCRTHLPQMATVRPRVFCAPPCQPDAKGETVEVVIPGFAGNLPAKLIRTIANLSSQVKMEYAEIIVAGGRGLGKPEGFQLIQELADALGGVVGSSRPCVDAGWISYDHQVGQTGKTVRPKLYIAAGISGAIQHKVGMQGADFILAINSDPHAPIFDIATYGIVGNAMEVLPSLIGQIHALKAGGS